MSKQMFASYSREVEQRLAALAASAARGELDPVIDAFARCIQRGGVIQAFGTGHSEAFAMEIAGRAGGLIPTNRVALRDTVLWGERTADELIGNPPLERDDSVVAELFATIELHPDDLFIIASNSGGNGSVVGLAQLAKERGHTVIAVTSFEHTDKITSGHPSGLRLKDIADIAIDNLAPFGDAVLSSPEHSAQVAIGAVSSLTSAYIAQLLTIGTAARLAAEGGVAPVYLSANIPGGDEHNRRLEANYGARVRRVA